MSKKRFSRGRGFGKPRNPGGVGQTFDYDGLLSGEQVLIAGPVRDQRGRIKDFYSLCPHKKISTKFPSLSYVIDTTLTREFIYLARRRQLEEGEGLLTLTPKNYHQRLRKLDDAVTRRRQLKNESAALTLATEIYRQQQESVEDLDGEVIFNWWTLDEISSAPERSTIFGLTRIFKELAEFLISNSSERFPVILLANPLSQDDEILDETLTLTHPHLMLTVSLDPEKAPEGQNISLQEQETVALTDLIPNSVYAEVDIRKLSDYCLSERHPQGKHKARLFAAALGMTNQNAAELRYILLQAATQYTAQPGRSDEFGQRYTIDFPLQWEDRKAMIRSGWIVEHTSGIPRLTTCYPL